MRILMMIPPVAYNKWLQTYLFDKTSLVMLNVSSLGCYTA